MIPSNNLRPCVAAIAELVRAYNATAVLCTATQPAIDEMLLEYSKKESVVELCPDVDGMFEKFRRTSFEKEGRLTTDELVSRLESQQQVQQVQARIWVRRQAAAQQALSRMMMWLTETTERSNISDI